MIKLRIKKKVEGKIIEKIIDYDGTYDGRFLTFQFNDISASWQPTLVIDDWEVIEQIKNDKLNK